jgi:hypothetical protein
MDWVMRLIPFVLKDLRIKSVLSIHDPIQGGSDISGTLSKLHHRNKKSYFLLIISHKTVSALFRRGNKKKKARSGIY